MFLVVATKYRLAIGILERAICGFHYSIEAMIWIGAAITLMFVITALAIWRISQDERDGNWHPDSPTTMRRLVSKDWETRPMSEDEVSDYQRSERW